LARKGHWIIDTKNAPVHSILLEKESDQFSCHYLELLIAKSYFSRTVYENNKRVWWGGISEDYKCITASLLTESEATLMEWIFLPSHAMV
jgi:hypothetical protein